MLLQLFARGYAHVPRFGDVGVKDARLMPIVVLLSNDIRHDLSAPLRSRCVYTWMDVPTPREEVTILFTRVPDATPQMVACVSKLLECIRTIPGVQDKPALREGITLLKALTRDGVSQLEEEELDRYLCYIAKRHGDRDYLSQALARIELAVNDPHDEIDLWVREEAINRMRACVSVAA
jgi:MoxR-like ATPase